MYGTAHHRRLSTLLLTFLLGWYQIALAKHDFTGTKIRIGVQAVGAVGKPARAHAVTWGKRTGGEAVVLGSDISGLFVDYMTSLTTSRPTYDVLLFPSAWVADFYPYLAEVPNKFTDSENFDDIHPIYRDRMMTWAGKWIAVTVDGDLFNGYYRKDLFRDEDNRQAFRKQYGYGLFPPDTWTQYRNIAAFFQERSQGNGMPLYGTAEAFARNGQQIWTLFSRAAAYTNHPDFPGGQFFDPDTMRPEINNPGWLRAVREYKDILSFSPPNALEFGIVQARKAFLEGTTAMVLDWGDTAQLAADPTSSKISGNVGYFVLPGTQQIWDGRLWRWTEQRAAHKAPFLAFGGWVAGVPKNSHNQEAAWDYIMWFSSPENSLRDVVTSGTGVNPYRFTHFSNIDAWTQALSMPAASEYLDVVRKSLDSPYLALDLRIPGFYRYAEALEQTLSKILRDEIPVKAGMDQVAKAWEAITDDLGREQQLVAYRSAMGLPKTPGGPKPGQGRIKDTYRIGFSQATTTEPWRLLFNKELRAEAAKHPEIELIVRDAMDSIPAQISHLEEFIETGVDAILVSPKVTEEITPPVSEAFSRGIPTFVLAGDVANDRYTQYIGGDNREIGRAAGRRAVEILGGKGAAVGNILEIWGTKASTPANDRHLGFTEITSQEPGLIVVNEPRDGDWKQDIAYDIMAQALDDYPKIDLVFAHNDPMAYGAHLAARDVDRSSEIAFLGVDGIPAEGVKWVVDGELDATFLYKAPGAEAIQQALRFLHGDPVKKRILLPTMVIDKSNGQALLDLYHVE